MKIIKQNKLTVLLFTHLMWFSASVSAQVCNEKQITQNISPGNFTSSEITNVDSSAASGTTTATETTTTINAVPGLIWVKCIYGQKWNSEKKQCIGSPILLTWQEALQEANKMQSIIDGNIWRLPNIKELNSIIDMQCINPPYNLDVFPDTFASEAHGLWTSSPHITTLTPNTNAWYIDLSQGKLNFRDVLGDGSNGNNIKNFVRFVR